MINLRDISRSWQGFQDDWTWEVIEFRQPLKTVRQLIFQWGWQMHAESKSYSNKFWRWKRFTDYAWLRSNYREIYFASQFMKLQSFNWINKKYRIHGLSVCVTAF